MKALLILLLLLPSAHAQRRVVLKGHDAHGRWFDLSSQRGRMVVITFTSRHTQRDARTINGELQRRRGVMVVSVVDFRTIPQVGWKLALKKVRDSDRPHHIRHIVDKDGSIARGFGVDPGRRVDMFVVDKRGRLVGHYMGAQQLPEVLARIERRWAKRR